MYGCCMTRAVACQRRAGVQHRQVQCIVDVRASSALGCSCANVERAAAAPWYLAPGVLHSCAFTVPIWRFEP